MLTDMLPCLFMHYLHWRLHKAEEVIFDCNSGGLPYQHGIIFQRKKL